MKREEKRGEEIWYIPSNGLDWCRTRMASSAKGCRWEVKKRREENKEEEERRGEKRRWYTLLMSLIDVEHAWHPHRAVHGGRWYQPRVAGEGCLLIHHLPSTALPSPWLSPCCCQRTGMWRAAWWPAERGGQRPQPHQGLSGSCPGQYNCGIHRYLSPPCPYQSGVWHCWPHWCTLGSCRGGSCSWHQRGCLCLP